MRIRMLWGIVVVSGLSGLSSALLFFLTTDYRFAILTLVLYFVWTYFYVKIENKY